MNIWIFVPVNGKRKMPWALWKGSYSFAGKRGNTKINTVSSSGFGDIFKSILIYFFFTADEFQKSEIQ